MITGLIILGSLLILLVLVILIMYFKTKKLESQYGSKSDQPVVSKEDDFQTILKLFEVPENHYKIVIAQSRNYNVLNCPAVIWKDEEKVKVLVLKAQPTVYEEEWEDFLFVSSSPYVNFIQFDGTEFPDWARQTQEIKDLFLPYAEVTATPGGIDRNRQQYWAGTICVYAPSMAEIFQMMGKPLSEYQIAIDNVRRMREDGSIPSDMLAQRDAEKKAIREAAEAAAASATAPTANNDEMNAVWEAIKRLESQQKEDISAEEINKLNAYLITEKRFEDLERSTTDKEFQKELLNELKNIK